MKAFADRVVVVTGAGSGIGRATALAFGREGARLHLVDVHRGRLQAVVSELQALGAWVSGHALDVRDAQAVEALAAEVYERWGRVDVLVNNAGVGHSALVQETPLEDWKWVLDVNLWGVVHGVHSFGPRMIDQGGDAHIVNVASIAGMVGIPSMAPYCASKFAVVGLSESLGAELAPHGICVTALCPGVVSTDIVRAGRLEGAVSASKQRVLDFYRRRGLPPEKVARDVLRAVRKNRPVQLTVRGARPLLWLRRLSPRAWRAAAGLIHRRLLATPARAPS